MKDIEKKVAEMLAGLNKNDIQKEKILGFLNTPEGRSIAAKFGGNSAVISDALKNMSPEDISKNLRQADFSKFSGKNIDEILKKLR